MSVDLIVKKLLVFFMYSLFVGFIYVFVFGKRLGVEKNLFSLCRVTIVFFVLFSAAFVLLPLVNGKIE